MARAPECVDSEGKAESTLSAREMSNDPKTVPTSRSSKGAGAIYEREGLKRAKADLL